MTVPHTSGTITLVKGSAIVNGTDTAWAAALIVGGTLYVNVPNVGAMALPILTVDSNIKITAAIPWNGANGTYTYALVRDGAFERQSVENAVKLSALLNEMRSAAVTSLSGLVPAADKLPYFGAQGAGALADFPLAARQLLAGGILPNGQLPARLQTGNSVFYEEGTFSPTLFGLGTAGTPVYVVQDGFYVRVGRTVTVTIRLVVTSLAGAAGQLNIGGMPFTVRDAPGRRPGFIPSFWSGLTLPAGSIGWYGFMASNTNLVRLHRASVTTANLTLDASAISGSLTIYGTMTYEAA